MKRVLLIKLSDLAFYRDASVKNAVPQFPSLPLATLAGGIREKGHNVKIFEYNIYKTYEEAEKEFIKTLKDFNPDFVGIGFTTPLYDEMKKVGNIVKRFNKKIVVVCGGPHVSYDPEECLKNSPMDIAVTGEGDFIFADIIDSDLSFNKLKKIEGISFEYKNKYHHNPKTEKFLQDLDKLPFPAWDLFDLKKYRTSKQMARKSPMGFIETSRGCIYGCCYCNKNIFGQNFRAKSAERVVDEMEYMVNLGFKELQIGEDMFTTDNERVMKICDLILKRGLKFKWATTTGIRVDSVTLELLRKMKQAGCYRVYYGLESGNDQVLIMSRKATNTATARKAVKWAKEAGLEVFGFFMIALPGETEQSMQDTIDFAVSLDLDLAKMSIMSPLPGTPIFKEFKEKGYLNKDINWDDFNYYTPPEKLYKHPNLEWPTIHKYYKKFYRRFYFRPGFMAKRLYKSVRHGAIIDDIKSFLSTSWN